MKACFPAAGARSFEHSNYLEVCALFAVTAATAFAHTILAVDATDMAAKPKIVAIDPPEKEFFFKRLDFHGIPIKSHKVVVDEALYAAYDRLSLLFTNLLTKQPMVISNLVAAGAELHIIGRDQVTTDLPEWRHDKGVPRPEYNGLTRDQRTRGMGGVLTSCGEENLLNLPLDRYDDESIPTVFSATGANAKSRTASRSSLHVRLPKGSGKNPMLDRMRTSFSLN